LLPWCWFGLGMRGRCLRPAERPARALVWGAAIRHFMLLPRHCVPHPLATSPIGWLTSTGLPAVTSAPRRPLASGWRTPPLRRAAGMPALMPRSRSFS
jgi:hypothetical protein